MVYVRLIIGHPAFCGLKLETILTQIVTNFYKIILNLFTNAFLGGVCKEHIEIFCFIKNET